MNKVKYIKQLFLYISKLLGLFWFSRYLTRKGLRILCYHGFALTDESMFRPKYFMNHNIFQRRLEYLKKHDYPILNLEKALYELRNGTLPDCTTVITFDDGSWSVYNFAVNLLKKNSFPATIYVTTYYCQKETPIFRLVIQYMFWKTTKDSLDIYDLDHALSGRFNLNKDEEKDKVTWKIINFGEKRCEEQQRLILEGRLGELLNVDFHQIYSMRILSLVTCNEIRSLVSDGMDIQLHTHRHKPCSDDSQFIREIADNKSALEPLVGKPLEHLAYPEGFFNRKLWPYIEAAGIKSAATCESGLNYFDTPSFELKRFLDGNNISNIEFEAEMSGYSELLRLLRSALRNVF